jgi:hypothetical protein
MSKELPYFRFTAFEWLNGDISLEDYKIKGIFSDVCAYYWFKDCSITQAKLKQRFSNASTEIESLINSGIIKRVNGSDFLEITFLNEQFDQLSELRKARQDAGSKGGKQKRSKAKAKLKQNPSYKDKDKDKERYIVPPSLEMVKSYCILRKNKVDPQYFHDKNNSIGWVTGKAKTPIKDWQALIRTWEKYQDKNLSEVIPRFNSGPGK